MNRTIRDSTGPSARSDRCVTHGFILFIEYIEGGNDAEGLEKTGQILEKNQG